MFRITNNKHLKKFINKLNKGFWLWSLNQALLSGMLNIINYSTVLTFCPLPLAF